MAGLSNIDKRIVSVWEALFAGDAMGMPTEFMSREEIRETYGTVLRSVPDPRYSRLHRDMPRGSVTDDSEQNLYLFRQYQADGCISVAGTVAGLLRWVEETDAVKKHYIGASSQQALERIKRGESPYTAGRGGATCGGIMRTPCVVLFDPYASEEDLAENIKTCLLPTHYSAEAFEAAGGYGFALRAALHRESMEGIFAAAERGAELMRRMAEPSLTADTPFSAHRIRMAGKWAKMEEAALLDWLFYVIGCGTPAADVCGAVFTIFAKAGENVFQAIQMGAAMGGDTDTIAALTGALSAAYAGSHNIPGELIELIQSINGLDTGNLAEKRGEEGERCLS